MPAHIQYNENEFKSANNFKVVLSEECYTRLLGDANLCGLHMGSDFNEYGTMLYGLLKQDQNDNYIFHFITPSEFDDYTPNSKRLNLNTTEMQKELIENAIKKDSPYNCIAHVHTHPYLDITSKFLSEEDLHFYETYFSNWENQAQQNGEILNSLSCLITISASNIPAEDDISFIYYDTNANQFYNIPNISVIMHGQEIPLNKSEESFRYDDGSIIQFDRTLLERQNSLRSR